MEISPPRRRPRELGCGFSGRRRWVYQKLGRRKKRRSLSRGRPYTRAAESLNRLWGDGRKRAAQRAAHARRTKAGWMPYAPKNRPGVSGERSSDGSGAAEAGSINSGLSFFTLPTASSTFHAVILSALNGRSRSTGANQQSNPLEQGQGHRRRQR